MFVANGQGTEEIRSRINLARSAFSRLQSCLWSRREISLRTRGRVYQAVVRSILLYGCETWPVRVADERMLKGFYNDSTRRILHVRRRDCGTASPPLPYKHTDTARAKKAPLVWTCRETSRRRADQGSSPSHTASHVVQTSWRPAEDMGNHDQGRPVTGLLTASLRPHTMEEGLGESL